MERLSLSLSQNPTLIRAAFEAKRNGEFEDFIQSYDINLQRQLRLMTTPGISSNVHRSSLVSDVPIVQSSENKSITSTWDAHEKWVMKKVEQGDLPEEAIVELKISTKEVSDIISNSELDKIYGLVVGYVQSGKTAHYTGLIARAIDEGYTFIVVISGTLSDLRKQTQLRLIKDLVGIHNEEDFGINTAIPIDGRKEIQLITGPNNDINSNVRDEIPTLIRNSTNNNNVTLAVVKKHVIILENLRDGLKRDPPLLENQRLLIIDDECDHATVNTGGRDVYLEDSSIKYDEEEDDEIEYNPDTDPSRTNIAIRNLLKCFKQATYVGYTATPFANVLIGNREDDKLGHSLYPRNFIYCMKRPHAYFGSKEFFGDLNNPDADCLHICDVDEDIAIKVRSIEKVVGSQTEEVVPESLQFAMMDFILTGIAREIRRKHGKKQNKHHTMLIHVSRLIITQQDVYDLVGELLEKWKSRLYYPNSSTCKKFIQLMKSRWNSEFVRKNGGPLFPTWDDIEEELLIEDGWINEIEIKMLNSLTDDQLDYESAPQNVIAIGGNKLSRGLTLEGLCISYFVRQTKLYDSLMQMGRWFGYRNGYEDLVRVHTTSRIFTWFQWLVMVEDYVRTDIEKYSILGVTPSELSVRIPMHPEMKPTARNKMKDAIVDVIEYRGRTIQSIRLPIDEPDRLEYNLSKTSNFISTIGTPELQTDRIDIWGEVESQKISKLIKSLSLDGPPDATFDTNSISRFIENKYHDEKFIVAYAGGDISRLRDAPKYRPKFEPEWPVNIRYIGRSQRSKNGMETGDLRVIAEPRDFEQASAIDPLRPLLIIYLVAPGSKPSQEALDSGRRLPLPDHGYPIIGVALKFPDEEGIEGKIREIVHVKGIRSELDEG